MKFKKHDLLVTKGLDFRCCEIDINVRFVEYLDVPYQYLSEDGSIPKLDCIIFCEGINVLADSARLRK